MTAGPREQAELRGHFAGFVSRFAAYVVDAGTSTGIFMLVLATVSFAASVLVGHPISWSKNDLLVAIVFWGWQFVYYAYSWAANGKTFGMALLGVRVVRADGANAGVRRAIIRTLAFPLSFLLFGLGFAGILVGRDRRALHDVIAGTAVVYTWDARAARLRFLDRDASGPPPAAAAGLGTDAAGAAGAVPAPRTAPEPRTAPLSSDS